MRVVGEVYVTCLQVLVWIGVEASVARAALIGLAVAVPHLLIDDGHLVTVWLREIKRAERPSPALTIAVDQSFHVACLLGAALLCTA